MKTTLTTSFHVTPTGVVKGPTTVTTTGPSNPYPDLNGTAWLVAMHKHNGHLSPWRCRLAIAFYNLSHRVSYLGDKVGCR